ncbi:MAG: imidazolonepropionase, partial [Bdellovibrionales bacterium]|nr:imidazolonepropionase [Bdellovibrionales bacterium]
MVLKCFRKINELWTLQKAYKKEGRAIRDEDLHLIKDAAIVSVDGVIKWVGADSDLNHKVFAELGVKANPQEYFYKDSVIVPAFVESHTHTVFAGDRSHEFEMRNQGISYQEIAAKGGGILNTVEATRLQSKKGLIELAQKRVNHFVEQGVCTLEIKSGYGLDEKNEVKILEVIKELTGPEIIATYLGPHALAPEFSREEYQEQ